MTSTFSDPATVTSTLEGVWLHDPDDPDGTARNLRYGRSRRTGSVDLEAQDTRYAGRTYAVTDFGPTERQDVAVDATVTDRASVDGLYAMLRARKPLYFRDNRGRAFLSRITSVEDRDEDHGSTVHFVAGRVEE